MNMKKTLIMTVTLLALTLSACGGKNKKSETEQTQESMPTEQTQTAKSIESMADSFAEKIIRCVADENFDRLESIGTEMGEYISTLDEAEGETFGSEFAAKIYEYSDEYGFGEAFATEFLQSMVDAMMAELPEE